MNVILKAWRNFKLAVAKRRQTIGVENKFQLGDWVTVRDPSFDLTGSKFYQNFLHRQSFRGAGEVVDAFYGFQMHLGYRWHYKVSYKKKDKVIVLYEEQEICIDAAWIRDQKLKKLGI
jgi:hypothetical protein